MNEWTNLTTINMTVNTTITLDLNENEDDSFWTKYMMLIFESTSYFFYSIIFLIGITGNSVVIYVLLNSVCSPNRYNLNQFQDAPTTVVKRASFKTKEQNYNNNINNNNNNNAIYLTPIRKKQNVSFKNDLPNNNLTNDINAREIKRAIKYSDSQIVNEPLQQNDNYDDTNNKVYSLVSFKNENKSWLTSGRGETNFKSELYSTSNGTLPGLDTRHPTRFKHLRQLLIRFIKEKLSVTNFYLLNLAFTDFSYLISIPFLLITIKMKSWIFGEFLCRFYFSLCYLCQSSSVFILVVLSIDRYLSVKYPHKVALFRSSELARIVMFISWSLSFLFITPIIIYSELNKLSNDTYECRIQWPPEWNYTFTKNNTFFEEYFTPLHGFTIYSFLLNYLIPVSTIVILYTAILHRLHRKSKIKKSKTKTKSNRKITRMVLTIIVCYLICWSPYWFSQIFNYFYQQVFKNENTAALFLISHFVQIIAYLSSALNPFIYSYMSEAFRTNLKFTFKTCCNLYSDDSQVTETTIVSVHSKPSDKLKKKNLSFCIFSSNKNKLNHVKETRNHRIKKDIINPVIEEKLRTSQIEKLIKAEDKTFIYKTKSNFAFAINFHPFSIRDKLFLKRFESKIVTPVLTTPTAANDAAHTGVSTDATVVVAVAAKSESNIKMMKSKRTSNSSTTMSSVKNSHSCNSNLRKYLKSDDSKHNLNRNNINSTSHYNEYHFRNIDDDFDDDEDDDVFEHQSIISYFK